MFRSQLEYALHAWSPYHANETLILEERRATKFVSELSELSYEVRLRALNFTTLSMGRIRDDMIQLLVLKCLQEKTTLIVATFFITTKGIVI